MGIGGSVGGRVDSGAGADDGARLVAVGGSAAGVLGARHRSPMTANARTGGSGCWTVDHRLGLTRAVRQASGLLELAYLLVYPLVPAGLLAIAQPVRPGLSADYCLAVLTGGVALLRPPAAAAHAAAPCALCRPSAGCSRQRDGREAGQRPRASTRVGNSLEHPAQRPRRRRRGRRRDGRPQRLAVGARCFSCSPWASRSAPCAVGPTTLLDTILGVALGLLAGVLS